MKNWKIAISPCASIAVSAALLLTPIFSGAALTDLADEPISNITTARVKPNILFTLDDSGSMNWEYMPDDLQNRTNSVGLRNHMCNLVYYNPSTNYSTPIDSAGNPVNTSTTISPGNSTPVTFTSAYDAGFFRYTGESNSTRNLSSSFRALIADGVWTSISDAAQTAYYWKYLGSGTVIPLSAACNMTLSSTIDSTTTEICTDGTLMPNVSFANCAAASKTALWRKTIVSSSSGPGATDERQNFANWYSYYRKRLYMMKSASGRAFSTVTDAYRVGLVTINPGSPVSSSKYLAVSDFNSTQRANWYNKLYSQTANNSTPLREALSRAGRYFAHKTNGINSGMSDDPVQYSCQQNFSILTTDGYWNGGGGLKLDGTTPMDNQDGVLSELDAYNDTDSKFAVSPRPIYDGAAQTYTYSSASNEYRNVSCVAGTETQRRTVQYQSCTNVITNNAQTRTSSNSGSSWSSWNNTSTCDYDLEGGTQRDCRNGQLQTRTSGDGGGSWTVWSNTTSCGEDNSGNSRRECRRVNTNSCGGSWTNTQCTNMDLTTMPVCQSLTGTWSTVASCSPASQNGSGVATECQTVNTNGYKQQYRTITTTASYTGPNQGGTSLSGPNSSNTSWIDVNGTCPITAPTLPSPNPQPITTAGPPTPPTGCSTWPCDIASSSGGSSDSLADTAQYYYKRDLRDITLGNCTGVLGTGIDVCNNNVKISGTGAVDDKASWQHMTTFTMGLGLSGTLNYIANYKSASSGDYYDIQHNSRDWPVPSANDPTALDDLWHAAVNGRGDYFSAGDPDSVISGLNSALVSIDAELSSAAAASTSNLEPVAGDNFAFIAKFVTQEWTGELEAREIDIASGVVQGTVIWSAKLKLDATTKNDCDPRNLFLFRDGAANNMVELKWNTYACNTSGGRTGSPITTINAAEQAYFNNITGLTQYTTMSTAQRTAAAGSELLNFIRGQRGKEVYDAGDVNRLYRSRNNVLGDIVHAQPVYLRAPSLEFDDTGYAAFKMAQASRTPMVFAAANDGFLHAFYAGSSVSDPLGGQEAWAFMPTMVLPNLYRLADNDYKSRHTYYVNGTPTISDIYDVNVGDCNLATPSAPGTCWKTILVGGLGKGGKGYYALDVTNPSSPKALWEFKHSATCYNSANSATWGADCHIGYTFSNPHITKINGEWVVILTSGLNNVNPIPIAGDGQGYLYILDAVTGRIKRKISTPAGSPTTPSGLNMTNTWVENFVRNNTTARVYGGDLLGNLWRFDVNDIIPPSGVEATLLTQLVDPLGSPQPITTIPELAEIGGQPYVLVGTGKYLGVSDLTNTQTQTVWSIRDSMSASALTGLRSSLAKITLANSGSGTSASRTATCTANCSFSDGWFADLPDTGERINVGVRLALGTLAVASNVPTNDTCTPGGYSWLNFFTAANGLAVLGGSGTSVGRHVTTSSGDETITVGITFIKTTIGVKLIATTSRTNPTGGNTSTYNVPTLPEKADGKRISWREIISQ